MKETGGLWTASFGEIGATLKSLQDQGVTLGHLARLRADPQYAKRVAEFMLRGGVDDSAQHKFKELMGDNFFGVGEWATFYGASFSQKQIPEFPWSEDVLNSTCPICGGVVKDCHFAFLGLDRLNGKPLTILRLQELHPSTTQPRFYLYPPSWYSKEKFAVTTTMGLRWYLLHKNTVPGSESKTYQEQVSMLPTDYEVPSAIAEITKDLLIFKKTGVYVNASRYGRCSDVDSGGGRVFVGSFGAGGLIVSYCWDDHRNGIVGVAASRKF